MAILLGTFVNDPHRRQLHFLRVVAILSSSLTAQRQADLSSRFKHAETVFASTRTALVADVLDSAGANLVNRSGGICGIVYIGRPEKLVLTPKATFLGGI